jgi:hypothetical protein
MNRLMQDAKAAGHSETFTREKNEETYRNMSEPESRDNMIIGNMALVTLKVDTWVKNHPELFFIREDLISAGMLGLCEAVDYLRRTEGVVNPTGCIYHFIDAHLSRLVAEESTISVSYNSQWEAEQAGKPIELPRPLNDSATTQVFMQLEDDDPIAALELQDELDSICMNQLDRLIIKRRSEGCTDEEIAHESGHSRQTIQVRREHLYNIFLSKREIRERE